MRDRITFGVINPKTTTIQDLLDRMMTERISQFVLPYGDELFVHIAVLFDRVESSKLEVHLSKVTLAAIQKANARTEGSG